MFTMPANNTTVSGVFKQDPELAFSAGYGTAYVNAPQDNNLPTLSYVSGFTGGVYYSATGSEYANDIVFSSGGVPSIEDDSSAYTYIWSNDGTIEVTAVALSYTTDNYYSNSAEYALTLTKK